MKANGLAARVEKLEQRRGAGVIVAIRNADESEADRRRRAIAEGGYIDGPHLCIIVGTSLDAAL